MRSTWSSPSLRAPLQCCNAMLSSVHSQNMSNPVPSSTSDHVLCSLLWSLAGFVGGKCFWGTLFLVCASSMHMYWKASRAVHWYLNDPDMNIYLDLPHDLHNIINKPAPFPQVRRLIQKCNIESCCWLVLCFTTWQRQPVFFRKDWFLYFILTWQFLQEIPIAFICIVKMNTRLYVSQFLL